MIILVILIIIAFFYFKSSFSSDLYNGSKWSNYRIGDVYMLSKKDPKYHDPNHPENVLYHKKEYSGSIANEYINQNEIDKNPKLLLDIINSKSKDTSSHSDTLFLHIRTGDVICDMNNPWIKQVNGPLYYSKMGDTQWWNGILNYISRNNIRKVVIISGTHKRKCLNESMKYLDNRKAFLLKNFPYLDMVYRLGQSPDEDILMCAHVEHFITTGGGFGNLIKEINEFSLKRNTR